MASLTKVAIPSLHLLPGHHVRIVSFVRCIPAAFVSLSCVLNLLNPVQVLDGNKLFAKVIVKKLFVAPITEDSLLL